MKAAMANKAPLDQSGLKTSCCSVSMRVTITCPLSFMCRSGQCTDHWIIHCGVKTWQQGCRWQTLVTEQVLTHTLVALGRELEAGVTETAEGAFSIDAVPSPTLVWVCAFVHIWGRHADQTLGPCLPNPVPLPLGL